MNYSILGIVILCLNLCCKKQTKDLQSLSVTNIDLDSVKINASYSDIFDFSFIVLHDLPEDEGIIHLEKIYKFQSGYVCWDNNYKTIYIFDNQGKYIDLIRKIGGGPEEYVDIGDVCFSESDQSIHILDRAHYLVKYDLQGNGISKVLLPEKSGNIIADFNGEIILYSGPRDNCVIWKLEQGGTLNCFDLGSNVIEGSNVYTNQRFSRSPHTNNIYFTEAESNVIYQLADQKIQKRFVIDLENNGGENRKINRVSSSDKLLKDPSKPSIYNRGHLFSARSWIIFALRHNRIFGFWNRPTKYQPNEYILYHPKFGVFSSHNLEDDTGNFFYWRIRGAYDNALIHHMYYQDVERIINEGIDLRTENGGRVLDQLDATSEVLMLMKLKTMDPPFANTFSSDN